MVPDRTDRSTSILMILKTMPWFLKPVKYLHLSTKFARNLMSIWVRILSPPWMAAYDAQISGCRSPTSEICIIHVVCILILAAGQC